MDELGLLGLLMTVYFIISIFCLMGLGLKIDKILERLKALEE